MPAPGTPGEDVHLGVVPGHRDALHGRQALDRLTCIVPTCQTVEPVCQPTHPQSKVDCDCFGPICGDAFLQHLPVSSTDLADPFQEHRPLSRGIGVSKSFDSVEVALSRREAGVAGGRNHRIHRHHAQLTFEGPGPFLGGALPRVLFVDPGVVDEVELAGSERIHADDAEKLLAESFVVSVSAHILRRNRGVAAQALGRCSTHALAGVEPEVVRLRALDDSELHSPPPRIWNRPQGHVAGLLLSQPGLTIERHDGAAQGVFARNGSDPEEHERRQCPQWLGCSIEEAPIQRGIPERIGDGDRRIEIGSGDSYAFGNAIRPVAYVVRQTATEALRVLAGRLEDQEGDRVQVECVRVAPETKGFERNRASAREAIEHARRFVAIAADVSSRLPHDVLWCSPLTKRLQKAVLAFAFVGCLRCTDQRGIDCCPAGYERASCPPQMQGRDMAFCPGLARCLGAQPVDRQVVLDQPAVAHGHRPTPIAPRPRTPLRQQPISSRNRDGGFAHPRYCRARDRIRRRLVRVTATKHPRLSSSSAALPSPFLMLCQEGKTSSASPIRKTVSNSRPLAPWMVASDTAPGVGTGSFERSCSS